MTDTITGVKRQSFQNEVGMTVMKRSLDSMKAQGQAALSLLEGAAQTQQARPSTEGMGQKIDVNT